VKQSKRLSALVVKQICDKCGGTFYNYRIKKYCSDKCRLDANRLFSQLRYDKLRRALLATMQQSTRKEVGKK